MRWRDRDVRDAERNIAASMAEQEDREFLAKWERSRWVRLADAVVTFMEAHWFAIGLVIGGLLCIWAGGCAPVVNRTPNGNEVKFSEAKGGVIAAAVSHVTDTDVDSITFPTVPPTTILLRNTDDPGLLCHEARHRDDMLMLGQFEFTRQYLVEIVRVGYIQNRFEIAAREAQAVCDAQGIGTALRECDMADTAPYQALHPVDAAKCRRVAMGGAE